MIALTNIDGRTILLNPEHIVEAVAIPQSHYGTRAVVKTVLGHVHEVQESHKDILRLIEAAGR